jgi:hypothetical protein
MAASRHTYVRSVIPGCRARVRAAFKTSIVRACIVAGLASLCVAAAGAQTRGGTDSTVTAIRALYEKGAYLAAEVEARRFLEQQTPDDSLHVAAEQYLAFALVAQGKAKAAVRHFTVILDIDSTFELDPVYTSPKILASFIEAQQLKRSLVHKEPESLLPIRQASVEGVSWRTLVFPGWEQAHQGRAAKGYALIGAGALAVSLSVAFEIERSNARSEYLAASTPDQASTRYDRYNRLTKAGTYSLIACAAVYLLSEIDAFLYLPHSDVVSLRPDEAGIRLAIRF